MFTADEKIEHLRHLGFVGDLDEVKKAYSGQFFNPKDANYQKLLKLSKDLCDEYSQILGDAGNYPSPNEMKEISNEKKIQLALIEKRRKQILNDLFPGSGVIFNAVQGLSVVIGMVDFGNNIYMNKGVEFSPYTQVFAGDYCLMASNVSIGDSNYEKTGELIKFNKVNIQNDVWLCSAVKISGNSNIGEQSVLGLGAVVRNQNTPANSLLVGIPA